MIHSKRSNSHISFRSAQRLLLSLCFVLIVCVAWGEKPDSELSAISERGRQLAEYDSAAWKATDVVMAAYPNALSSGRYIAHKTEVGWVVDFGRLNSRGDGFMTSYEAVEVANSPHFMVKSFAIPREDRGWNLHAAEAIETATREFGSTDRPYNIAVLPTGWGCMYVYLYPAQTKTGIYPLGADVRYRVSSDGLTIAEKRQMHKSVIELVSATGPLPVQSGYHTHVLSDLPEDTDVMLVLIREPRVPETVLARHHLFSIGVDGGIVMSPLPK